MEVSGRNTKNGESGAGLEGSIGPREENGCDEQNCLESTRVETLKGQKRVYKGGDSVKAGKGK